MTRFAIIGGGWRAQMFLDVARALGTVACVGVVAPRPRPLSVPVFTSLDDCLHEQPVDFVLTATPRDVTPTVVVEAVERGLGGQSARE